MNSLRQKLSHPAKVYFQGLTVLFVLLRRQRSGAFGYSSEEIHPDPAEVHQERVEAGKDRLCGYRRVCPLLVTVRLRHTHFLGRVRHISELMLGFQIHGELPQSAACLSFTAGNRDAIVWCCISDGPATTLILLSITPQVKSEWGRADWKLSGGQMDLMRLNQELLHVSSQHFFKTNCCVVLVVIPVTFIFSWLRFPLMVWP